MKALDFLYRVKEDTACEWTELDEAILELEALQQPKNCEGCYLENSFSNTCLTCKRNYTDNFKENK